jgi:hypothetical protein
MAASSKKVMGRPLSEKQNMRAPVRALGVMKNGQLRPLQYVNEKGDVRRLSGQFLLMFKSFGSSEATRFCIAWLKSTQR